MSEVSPSASSAFQEKEFFHPSADADTDLLVSNLFSSPVQISQAATEPPLSDADTSLSGAELAPSLFVSLANNVFILARDEIFEDGVETEFSKRLVDFTKREVHNAMDAICSIVLSGKIKPDVVSETLRILGDIDDSRTFHTRLWLLERSLWNGNHKIRDGAIVGLSFLDTPVSIEPLQRVLAQETIPELKKDIEQVISQLRDTESGLSSQKS